MRGKLIIGEGLDCTGKTTAIKEILRHSKSKNFVYSKGIGSDSIIGKISKRFHSTLMFFLELIWRVFVTIKPNLKKGKIILQDRYDISIISYVPLTKRWYNRLIIHIFRKLIVKPSAIVYFYLPLKEHIERLKKKGTKYELTLANNPYLVSIREKEYLKWYNKFKGPRIKINTKKNNIKRTAKILEKFISKVKYGIELDGDKSL